MEKDSERFHHRECFNLSIAGIDLEERTRVQYQYRNPVPDTYRVRGLTNDQLEDSTHARQSLDQLIDEYGPVASANQSQV